MDAWEQRWGRHRYAASSRIWFTLWNGALTQVYYPIGDRPEFRDLQHFITDGEHRIRIVEALLSAADRDEAGRGLLERERGKACLGSMIIYGGSSSPAATGKGFSDLSGYATAPIVPNSIAP